MARTAPFGPGRRGESRVVINRAAMDTLDLAVADAMAEAMRAITHAAKERVPVDTGQLRDSADWAVFNGSRKVSGTASKPRALRSRKGVISGIAGFSSPLAHLIERGTALRRNEKPSRATGRGPAMPFLLPATQAVANGPFAREVGEAIRRRGLGKPTA